MTEDQLIEQTIKQLESEFVGENKQYPTEEYLYDFNFENDTLTYKPEVFERYVEIYNMLRND